MLSHRRQLMIFVPHVRVFSETTRHVWPSRASSDLRVSDLKNGQIWPSSETRIWLPMKSYVQTPFSEWMKPGSCVFLGKWFQKCQSPGTLCWLLGPEAVETDRLIEELTPGRGRLSRLTARQKMQRCRYSICHECVDIQNAWLWYVCFIYFYWSLLSIYLFLIY